MTSRHYDVVVLGRSIGALCTAALLARRDFRVLLLGQREQPPTYRFEGRALKRRAFTFVAGTCPTWHRILHELAQTQTYKRKTRSLDPMFVVVAEGFRMEVPPDVALFAREIEREFPEVRQVVDEMYDGFARVNAAADAAFERDAIWPPGNFWERIETGRAASTLPLTDAEAWVGLRYPLTQRLSLLWFVLLCHRIALYREPIRRRMSCTSVTVISWLMSR
jgi:phytoene dehydrogenase-like protein